MRPNNDVIIGTLNGGVVAPTLTNANISGKPQWTSGLVRASFVAVVTGTTATGTLQLQYSDDQSVGLPAGQFTPTNWINLGSSVAVSAAGIYTIPAIASNVAYLEVCYEYMRLNWTDGSGGTNNGAISARMKSLGF